MILLQIQKPCDEPWENMHEVSGGRFCDLCSKKVLDLTNISDGEILKILENSEEKICGKVFKNQLLRPLRNVQQPSKSNYNRKFVYSKITAGFLATASLVNTVSAQIRNEQKTEVIVPKKETSNNKKEKREPQKTGSGSFKLVGIVYNKENKKPQENVEIKLITVSKIYTTKSDAKGSYFLEIPEEAIKESNLINFKTKDGLSGNIAVFSKQDFLKNHLKTGIKVETSLMEEYGEISQIFPTEKSLVFVEGKKFPYKTFVKSYMLYGNSYEVYYIPKEFTKVYTKDESINDVFICFIK